MIIQIRGTSGSGKTTVMRDVMNRLQVLDGHKPWNQHSVPNRKKPLFYNKPFRANQLYVLGHYESACGGCDNIGSAASVYELIQSVHKIVPNPVIICEGLLLSEDVKWTSQMKNVRCLFLVTPLGTCLERVKGRRAAAGNEKPLNPANTTNRVAVIERARKRLVELGVSCRRVTSDQAPDVILNLLGFTRAKGK